MKTILFSFVCFWLTAQVMHAQAGSGTVWYPDPETGNEVSISVRNIKLTVEGISYTSAAGQRISMPAAAIQRVEYDGETYISQQIATANGAQDWYLLQLVQTYDDFQVYRFTPKNSSKAIFYFSLAEDTKKIYPLADPADSKHVHPLLQTLFENHPSTSDPAIARYVETMKPNMRDIAYRYRVIMTGNKYLIPRFRWGVMACINSFQLWKNRQYIYLGNDTDKHIRYGVGLFADLPIGKALSLHAALYAWYYSAEWRYIGDYKDRDLVYKHTGISLPLSLRYTLGNRRNRLQPYLQVGVVADISHYDWKAWGDTKPSPPTYLPSFHVATPFGIGVEYRYADRHSAFLDLQYTYSTQTGYRKGRHLEGFQMTLSFSL